MPDYLTKLLLHANGDDGGVATVDSSYYEHAPITFAGNAQLDDAQKVFGTTSLLGDGIGDWISIPDSADWNFGSGNFTIDFRIRWNGTPASSGIMGQSPGAGTVKKWGIYWNAISTGKISFHCRYEAGTEFFYNVEWFWTPSANIWYHLAICRSGNSWYFFVDGIQTGGTQTQSQVVPDVAAALRVSADGENWKLLNGWLDEVRIIKGAAKWTSDFTPPTGEYDIIEYLAAAGTVAGQSSISGAVNLIVGLVGTIAGQSAVSGAATLLTYLAAAGTIIGQSVVSGAAYLATALSIAGIVAAQSVVSGAASLLTYLSGAGAVTGTSTMSGEISVGKKMNISFLAGCQNIIR